MINLLLAALMAFQDNSQLDAQLDVEHFTRKVGVPLMMSFKQQEPNPVRPQIVDSSFRYRTENPNYYQHNITASTGTLMDLVHLAMYDDTSNPSFTVRLLKYGFSAWMDVNLSTVAHEYGHISGFSRAGIDMRPSLYIDGEYEGTAAPHKIFFGVIVGHPSVTVPLDDWHEIVASFGTDTKALALYSASVVAGGLNQQQLLATRYAERYLDGNLSHLDSWSIIGNNLSTILYSNSTAHNDLYGYTDYLDAAGVRTSVGSIRGYSAFRLLSGSSIGAFIGMRNGIWFNTLGFVKPIHFNVGDATVYLPEFESFLCQTGPSVKMRLPIKLYGVSLAPSIEVSHGAEFGLKATVPIITPLTISGAVYAQSTGYWAEGYINLRLIKELSLVLGYEHSGGYTFHKDVFGATTDNSEHSTVVGVDLNFKF